MEQADVIIILGGGVNETGMIPLTVQARVQKGAELYRANVAPRILVSEKWGYQATYVPPKTEAKAMQELLVAQGIPETVILCEEKSKDSIGNAYFCKVDFLEPNHWSKIVVVTSDYHVRRSAYIFKKVLGPDYAVVLVEVPSENLSVEEIAQRQERGEKNIRLMEKFCHGIADGDDEKIRELMYTKHPAYADNPEISILQLQQMVGEQDGSSSSDD